MEKTALAPKVKETAEKFLKALQTTYDSGLQAVFVYGSALSGDFNERFSNINVLVVLDDTSLSSLKKISKTLRQPACKLVEPVFMTQEYIRRSLDTFPIEFLDILDNHLLLFGADLLQGLTVDHKHLRFQCEQELKARLIVLKSAFVRTQTKTDLEFLLVRSFNSYVHVVRNLVRLKGMQPPCQKDAAIKEFKSQFAINTDTLDRLLDLKTRKVKLSYAQLEMLLFDFVRELELITKTVDEF